MHVAVYAKPDSRRHTKIAAAMAQALVLVSFAPFVRLMKALLENEINVLNVPVVSSKQALVIAVVPPLAVYVTF
jgi:hypothetical protein